MKITPKHRKIFFQGTEKKTTRLKELLYQKNQVSHMMEAHSGLSAKIVERAGFPAIWGSGLSISAQLGVRDANEASWTQVVQVVDFMNQACNVPVLLDGDTGFGNFNNARRLVNRLELLGIAGVCIEDKLFPKTNSFITKGKPQELADVEEFCLKIRACKDAQKDPDFCVVARVEALIADHSMEEAIKRADAYYKAGADAILIHSKKQKADEIKEFLRIWNKRHPVVIVPTKYALDTTADEMEALGVNLIIWANMNIRASVRAMEEVSEKIWKNKHCGIIEKDIVSVDHIFNLQDEKTLALDEKKYLPQKEDAPEQTASQNFSKQSAESRIKIQELMNTLKKGGPSFSTVNKPGKQINPDSSLGVSKDSVALGVNPLKFIDHMRSLGIKFLAGVPDSLMDNLIRHFPAANEREDQIFHTIAANEGAALAQAAGFQVGSDSNATPPVVYLQNSGLGNIINPLLSLTHKNVYSIPVVILIGWRGNPSEYTKKDEPQHNVQGKYMLDMLKAMGMDTFVLPQDSDENAETVFSMAVEHCKKIQQPVFVAVNADTFQKIPVKKPAEESQSNLLTRRQALEATHKLTKHWKARVSTTGKLSRELYEITSTESVCKDFLMVGSMGHVFSFTVGVCQSGVQGNVICLDGDGSVLMHAGSLSSVTTLPPRTKLLHVGYNNQMHESVGSQPTAFSNPSVSLSGLASNMGYEKVFTISSESEAEKIFKEFESLPENPKKSTVWFVEWKISVEDPSSVAIKNLPRPKETPVERKRLFANCLI